MFWENERNGHHTKIAEVGVDSIVVTCSTCGTELARLTQKEYPKWRLAFNEANKIVREHSC
jgi:hypothetical protein